MPSTIITVVGATGTQGGSVVNGLLESGAYHVRGITRNPDSSASQALAKRGVEIVKADASDLESLKQAFSGSHAVFAVTDFFALFHLGAEKAQQLETEQGINLAKAAAATAGLQHYIWSTLPSAAGNKKAIDLHVPHMDSKYAVDGYIKTHEPDLLSKTTFIWLGYYATNFRYPPYAPIYNPHLDTHLQIVDIPGTTQVPLVNGNKSPGPFVRSILSQPEKTKGGKYVQVYNEFITLESLLQAWAKVQGLKAQFVECTSASWGQLWGHWAVELSPMNELLNVAGSNLWEPVDGEDTLGPDDLGLSTDELGSLEDALAFLKEGGASN